MKYPNVYSAENLIHDPMHKGLQKGLHDGRWVAVRAAGFASIGNKFYFAWKVFKGDWDALKWEGQE